jgi:hypothetical protein
MRPPLLDHQPDILAPRSALQRRRTEAGWGSGELGVCRGLEIVERLGERAALVPDPGRRVMRVFGLSASSASAVAALKQGLHPRRLDPFVQSVLVDAGILVRGDEPPEDVLEDARASFESSAYGVVTEALHPYDVAAIRRYIRHGVRTGAIPLGDPQVPRRHRAHNDPVLREHQRRLTHLISHVVGRTVKPSYAYLAAYNEGSVLHRHVDRPQCAYSMTIPVDYTPEPTLEASWPIRLGLQDAEVVVYQSLGDALVYAGPRVEHFREALPAGHISTSLLFHYVDADFRGSLD